MTPEAAPRCQVVEEKANRKMRPCGDPLAPDSNVCAFHAYHFRRGDRRHVLPVEAVSDEA